MERTVRFKQAAKAILLACGVPQTISRLRKPGIVILCYHSIQHDREALATTIGSGITHTAAEFEQQMALISRLFNPVTIDDVLSFLRGERAMVRRGVAITFDDGFRDNWEIAAPILDRYGLRATFYVTAGSIGTASVPWFCRLRWAFHRTTSRRWVAPDGQSWPLEGFASRHRAFARASEDCASRVGAGQMATVRAFEEALSPPPFPVDCHLMMDWDEIRALHRAGHAIGSHTMTHPNVAHVLPNEAIQELEESKHVIERELKSPVIHFSYPYPALEPNWNEGTVLLTKRAGYETATTCVCARVNRGQNPLCLPRRPVPESLSTFRWDLEAILAGYRP